MSNFIELTDYDASIHSEILDAVTRSDNAVIEICEDRAIVQMRSYLEARYDCDTIFNTTGENRNQLILMMAIDISLYHIFCAHNPMKLSPMRKERYDRAVEWLKAVSSYKLTIPDAPALSEDSQRAPSQLISNPKKTLHF